MKITTTKDKELSLVRALLHGDSGVGKTTSLATLPKEKTIIVAAERGLLPLRNENFRVFRTQTWAEVQSAFAYFSAPSGIDDAETKAAVEATRIIAIDSLSALAELAAHHIIEVDRKQLIKERTKDKSETPRGMYAEQLTQEDYGLLRTRIKGLVSAVCNLPYHIIFTCGSTWVEDRVTGISRQTPSLSGKTALEIPVYFDLVLHMESVTGVDGNNDRLWRTYNDGSVIAKDASGALDPFERPDWMSVFGKILGEKK